MNRNETRAIALEIIRIRKRDKWYKRWRNLAFLLMALLAVQWWSNREEAQPEDMEYIAMLNINEVIHQDSEFWDQFARIDSENAKAALILMNSPGGTPGDSERLYNAITELKATMPVTILVENQATSGAYLASLASDRIYAYNSALIGSIGVVFSNTVAKTLLDKIGIEQELFTTGANKGYPNSYENTPMVVEKNLKDVLLSDQKWFLNLVLERRNLDASVLPKIQEAQLYGAEDGIRLGLLDGLSSRQEQVEMLREEVGNLPLKNLEIDENESLLHSLLNPKRALGVIHNLTSLTKLAKL